MNGVGHHGAEWAARPASSFIMVRPILVAILILDTCMVNAFSVDADILHSSLLLASFWQAAP